MNAFIDNQLIQKIIAEEVENGENSLVESCIQAGILADEQSFQIIFGWPSLLEYIGQGSLFEAFPKFDKHNPLFAFITSSLTLDSEKDFLFRLYDQIFVECLTQVKALSQIHPAFILSQIQKKKSSALFSRSLDHYEKILTGDPANTLHHLILYLAWDRVCVNLALLFEHIYPDLESQEGLRVFKECLLESFQHITEQGKAVPGFFRLLEALYAYQMREEVIQTHTDAEWLALCQSSRALRSRENIPDVFYIDAALVDHRKLKSLIKEKEPVRVLTLDSIDKVKASLLFADYMIEKLKIEIPEWPYTFRPLEIICLKENDNRLLVDTIVRH